MIARPLGSRVVDIRGVSIVPAMCLVNASDRRQARAEVRQAVVKHVMPEYGSCYLVYYPRSHNVYIVYERYYPFMCPQCQHPTSQRFGVVNLRSDAQFGGESYHTHITYCSLMCFGAHEGLTDIRHGGAATFLTSERAMRGP